MKKGPISLALLTFFAAIMFLVVIGEIWTLWTNPDVFLPPTTRPTTTPTLMSLPQFVATVQNGSGVLVGVYATGRFAFPVAEESWQETTRGMVDDLVWRDALRPTTLLDAHNGLAGTHVLDLTVDDVVLLVFGDGRVETYQVTIVEEFQVVTESDGDHFIDLNNGSNLSWAELIQAYMPGPDTLAFATCLGKDGNRAWGRHFVFAKKSQ